GAATARRFAAEGARVACVDRLGERAKETARVVSAAGGEAFALETDVTDAAACERMVDQVVAHFAALTTLVNSAGVRPEGRGRARQLRLPGDDRDADDARAARRPCVP